MYFANCVYGVVLTTSEAQYLQDCCGEDFDVDEIHDIVNHDGELSMYHKGLLDIGSVINGFRMQDFEPHIAVEYECNSGGDIVYLPLYDVDNSTLEEVFTRYTGLPPARIIHQYNHIVDKNGRLL